MASKLWTASTQATVAAVLAGWAIVPEGRAEPAADEGLSVYASYTGDLWSVVQGGERRGEAYLDYSELGIDWSTSESSVPGGVRAHGSVVYTNGGSISAFAGDTHLLSSIEATDAARLYELWAEWGRAEKGRTIRLGLYDLNSEFDTSDTGGMFVNSTFSMGLDFLQSGEAGPSVVPLTSLGIRGQWRFDPQWMVQAALLDGVPGDLQHPRRFQSIRLSSEEGALGAVELEHQRGDVRWVIGHWRYSAKFERLDAVSDDGEPMSGRGNSGTYAFVDLPLAGEEGRRWHGMFRLGEASGRFNSVDFTAQAALLRQGGLLGRLDEQFGIAVAYARFGSAARAADADLTRSESVIELTWRLPVGGRFTLQPDVQYILNSGGRRRADDTVAVGLRVDVDLSP